MVEKSGAADAVHAADSAAGLLSAGARGGQWRGYVPGLWRSKTGTAASLHACAWCPSQSRQSATDPAAGAAITAWSVV